MGYYLSTGLCFVVALVSFQGGSGQYGNYVWEFKIGVI